MKEDKDLTKIL